MIFDPILDLDGLAQALIETLEELPALLFRDCLDEAAKTSDLHMSLLKQFLHLFVMHAVVQLSVLIAVLNLGVALDELKVMLLYLRLCLDQFAHFVYHLLILGEELRPVIDFFLQIAVSGHEDPF